MTGRIVALEGLDGSGKSTAIEHLKKEYESDDRVVFSREPTEHTYLGDVVRGSIFRENIDERAELFLFLADHAAHLQRTVIPALEEEKVVIVDRYIDSRVAYQTASMDDYFETIEDGIEQIEQYHDWSVWPDDVVFLDISPEVAVERSGSTNKMERRDHLRKVQKAYNTFDDAYNRDYTRIDAEANGKDAVLDDITDIVEEHLSELN